MLKNVLVSSLAIAEVICFSIYLKFKDSRRARATKKNLKLAKAKKVLALSVLKSKETQTESEEKNQRSMSDLLFQSAFLYLRHNTEDRVKHQDLSCRSCERAEAGNQHRSARAKSSSE